MARTGAFDPEIDFAAWFDEELYAVGWFTEESIPPSVGPLPVAEFPKKRGLTFFPG